MKTKGSLSSHITKKDEKQKGEAHRVPLGGGDVLVDLGGRQELVHDVPLQDLQRLGLGFSCVCMREGVWERMSARAVTPGRWMAVLTA